jgi:hypothetical protein
VLNLTSPPSGFIPRMYDGSLPYQNVTEAILWLQRKAAETENSGEHKSAIRLLIDEAQNFGASDAWGTLDPSLVLFARLLQLLQSRVQNR